jgi:hypothetical protein
MKRVPVFLTTTAQQLLRNLHPDLKRLIRQREVFAISVEKESDRHMVLDVD